MLAIHFAITIDGGDEYEDYDDNGGGGIEQDDGQTRVIDHSSFFQRHRKSFVKTTTKNRRCITSI